MDNIKNNKGIAIKIDNYEKAPKIIAKAKGILLEKMLQLAENNNIEVYKDEDLVESMFALEIKQEIPYEMYQAVAEIIVYCYNVNSKLKEKIDLNFQDKNR